MNTKLIGFVSVIHGESTRSRQRNARDMRQFPRLVIAAIAFVALLGASKAGADEVIELVMPLVQAASYDPAANTDDQVEVVVHDLSDSVSGLLVEAVANQGGAHAVGRVGLVDFAMADATVDAAGAGVELLMEFTVEDPQDRPQIKTLLNFKGVAASPPDPPMSSRLGGASWQVMIGKSDGGPLQLLVHDDLSSQIISAPQLISDLFSLNMFVESEDGGRCASYISIHGQLVSSRQIPNCGRISEGGSLELTHEPGRYLMRVIVLAGNNATIVGDPVWRPHPDNPDVVVIRHAPTGSPGAPLAGISPDDLAARGIDPTPFIEAGFFDTTPPPPPPSVGDTMPPTTVASPTPGPNANGWNKSAVTVTLSATDNAGASGVKEVHYSLVGAATGSQTVTGDSATVTISAEGATTLTYFAVDNAGNQEAPQTLTVRIDKTAPTLTGLPAAGCSLWPPDHRLVEVGLITAQDALSSTAGAPVVTVTSNEPASGTGDGDLEPDVVITGGAVWLRAERAGNGTGRVYTITATARDLAGNTASATATCKVPHDRRQTAKP